MSRHDDRVRFRHMLDHAHEALGLAKGRARPDLDTDRLLNLALTRLLEVVGEAAARVSPAGREKSPAVPWSEIVGLRNRIIHGYDNVDFDILWQIVCDDLPRLITALEDALGAGT